MYYYFIKLFINIYNLKLINKILLILLLFNNCLKLLNKIFI